MKGRNRVRLPAIAGIVILLLTGISALQLKDIRKPGAEQAIEIAETRSVSLETNQRDSLGQAFHEDARQAKLDTQKMVTADLARTLKREPAVLVAKR